MRTIAAAALLSLASAQSVDSSCPAKNDLLLSQDGWWYKDGEWVTGCRSAIGFSGLYVTLVTSHGSSIEDGTFTQQAFDGAKEVCQKSGCCVEVFIPNAPDGGEINEVSYQCEVEYAAKDSDLVLATGFLHQTAVDNVAKKFTTKNFAIVDVAYQEVLPNVEGVIFKEDEAGYYAGIIGGLVASKEPNKKLGVIGGVDVPPVMRFANGFINGVKSVCEACEVTVEYAGDWGNIDNSGVNIAKKYLDAGVEVIFGVGGFTGSSGIQYAASEFGFSPPSGQWTKDSTKRAYVIGVDMDEYTSTFANGAVEKDGSDMIITSALKKVSEGTYEAVDRVVRGQGVGRTLVLGSAEGGVGFAPCHETCADQGGPVRESYVARASTAMTQFAAGIESTGVNADGTMAEATTADESDDDEKIPTWAVLLIIVMGVLLCCVSTLMLYVYRKERAEGQAVFGKL